MPVASIDPNASIFRLQRYILFSLSAIPKNDGFGKIPRYGDRRIVLGWFILKNSIFAANI